MPELETDCGAATLDAARCGWQAVGMIPEPSMSDPRLADLSRRLPELRLLTAPADLEHYGRDWTRRWAPAPLAIALPASAEEVQAIVRWANEQRVAIVPSGGRTGLSGGAVAAHGELVLSLERMNRVLDFNAIDRTLTVQPGMILQHVHEAARQHDLVYPVDFAARGSCSIGGNIATNAGGIRVIRYGNTREWIAGLKVVTGNGELLEFNRGLIKNSSGYDFRQLLIGSEGTLGIVVEATLKLTDPPPPSQVMLLALPDMDALMQVFALFRAQLALQAFEFFTDRALRHVLAHGAQRAIEGDYPYYVVAEFDAADERQQEAALAAFEHALGQGWVSDGVIAQSEAQGAGLRIVATARRHHREPGAAAAVQERRIGAGQRGAGVPARDAGAAGARVSAGRSGLVRAYRRRQPAHQRAAPGWPGGGRVHRPVRTRHHAVGRDAAASWRQHFG